MNKQYTDLFQVVARNGALNAEKAMDAIGLDNSDKQEEIKVLTEMRDKFNVLEDKILKGETLEIVDYIQLYAGAMVSRNIIQKNIDTWTAIVKEYDDNLIPKLYEVANTTDDDRRNTLVDEFFS